MHDDQVDISLDQVRVLLDQQFPDVSGHPIRPVPLEGTMNTMFRIGDDYVARFPLRLASEAETRKRFEKEQSAGELLSEHLSVVVPKTTLIGYPAKGYPMAWAVQTWLEGTSADHDDPSNSEDFARDLARVIQELRAIPTGGERYTGSGRGGLLRDHDEWVQTCIEKSRNLLPVEDISSVWSRLRDLERPAQDVMSHGDLIPGNVLVTQGRLVGLVDLDHVGPADPALDLIAAWHLLNSENRDVFRDFVGSGPAEWERGKAWALQQSIGLVWYYETSNPPMSKLGRRTIQRILEDEVQHESL